jgi:hypothetical protein
MSKNQNSYQSNGDKIWAKKPGKLGRLLAKNFPSSSESGAPFVRSAVMLNEMQKGGHTFINKSLIVDNRINPVCLIYYI